MSAPANGLYVGCALTDGVPDWFVEGVGQVKDDLQEKGYRVLDFIGLEAGSAEDVYRWDIERCVGSCSLMLAVTDFPSSGLGMEMERANMLGTPLLAVAQTDKRVSRMITGAADVYQTCEFERYDQLQDLPDQFENFIKLRLGQTALMLA